MAKVHKTGRRKIHYRKAEFDPIGARTMQQLMSDALSKNSIVLNRAEPLGAANAELRLISDYQTVNGFLCGVLVSYERGRYQPVISDDPTAASLKLTAIVPPLTSGIRQQYVPGTLYFAVRNNHVVIMQSSGLRASAFENHLVWLLRTKTGLMTGTQAFVLKDEPQPATRDRIRKSHVKSVSIGRPLMEEVDVNNTNDGNALAKLGKETKKFQPDTSIVGLISGLFKDSVQFEKLGLDNTLFEGNLEVWIEIRYPKHSRSQAEDSVKLLDNLGIALRDIDDNETRLQLNDGSIIKGKELRISSDVEFEIDEKGLPKQSNLFETMTGWLEEQIRNGVVPPR